MYGHGIIDQMDDTNLDFLPQMLMHLMPRGIMSSEIDPIEELLAVLGDPSRSPGMIMAGASPEPQMDIKVIDLPGGGRMIMKRMQASHGGFIGCNPDRMSARSNGVPFAYGDKFPMSDPFQALLSLIYANGQKDELGKDVVEGVIEPKAGEVAGSKLVEDIKSYIESVKEGTKEFIDSDAGKRVTVTIDEYSDNAENIVNPGKEATLSNYKFTNNPFHKQAIYDLHKKANKVQTSLPKLAYLLGAYKINHPEVNTIIKLLKYSMVEDGVLTTANKDAQSALISKLSDIFKGPDGNVDEDLIKRLVYNTDIPDDDESIVTVRGYPIDVSKVKELTYEDGKKALTETIADLIFNDAKTEIDIDKFKAFLEDIVERL